MKILLITYVLISFLAGCANHSEVARLHSQFEAVKNSLNELSINFDPDLTTVKAEASAIKARSATIWAVSSVERLSNKLDNIFKRTMADWVK